MVAAVVAVALAVGGVMLLGGGDDEDKASDNSTGPSASTGSPEPEPSDSETEEPDDYPSDDYPTDEPDDYPSEDPDDYPSDDTSFDPESMIPRPSDGPVPAYQMEVGECFDIPAEEDGQNEPAECSAAHDGQIVHQAKLTKEYDTDSDVRSAAEDLCRSPLQEKGRGNSEVGGTLVQYPKATGTTLGFRTVTCSLTAGEGKKLYSKIS